jgi:hypothetical protein
LTRHLGLIVTDASPLITLAAGEAVECLTMPGVTVILPPEIISARNPALNRISSSAESRQLQLDHDTQRRQMILKHDPHE